MLQTIPEKLFFKIGEVAGIAGVEQHVLRYWEDEFDMLKPDKNRSGQRLYQKKDVELVLEIKRLLYGEKFTIAGAKMRLKKLKRKNSPEAVDEDRKKFLGFKSQIKGDLEAILNILDNKKS